MVVGSRISILFAIYLFLCTHSVMTAKIVGYPMLGGSQYIGMKRIAEELARRGHEVTIIVSSAQKIKPTKGVTHAVYKVPYSKDFLEKNLISMVIKGGIRELLLNPYSMPNVQYVFCEALLNDTKLLDPLKSFDLIITDISMICGSIIADYLDIMRIDSCPGPPRVPGFPSAYHSLLTLSYVPQMFSRNPEKMTFFQRVKNTLVFIAGKIIFRFVFIRRFQELKSRFKVKPERSLSEAMDCKELTFYLADFAVEYTYPLQPDQKLIGPLNIQPVKPLPPDLQQLIDSSGDDGAIIVSFGSNVASVLDKEKVDIMAEAFGRLKQKVIWRLQGYIPLSLSPNIKVVDWLPQNDLLAHKNLRAFVSHVGINSLYETLYRGVPVVALPLFGDQFDNAALLEERGLGLKLDYKSLTADDLYNTIQRVINEPSFRQKAQGLSHLLSDRPRSPAQEAADWIEYTLRHGGLAHLRPYSSQLAWYQYFLVDVVLLLVLIVFVVILLIKYTVRFVCWLCCRRNRKVKTQ